MKRYNVVITASALKDMEELYNYIAFVLNAPGSAKKLYFKIANAITTLDVFAERYKIFSVERERVVRRMIVDNYSVFYIIKEDNVFVVSVLYSSRNLEDVLKNNI